MISILDAVKNAVCLALVGAGGKTSAMFRLARAYSEPVFVAASAHLSVEQTYLAERCYVIERVEDLPVFEGGIPAGISLFCGSEIPEKHRVRGLDPISLERLRDLSGYHAVPLLIEADGSRGLPLKAPAEHEPPIPPFVQTVVVCSGMSGLGQPLDEAHVFRPEIFAAIGGMETGQAVDETALARVLRSPEGGLKNVPATTRRMALLNQADTPELVERAARLARMLLPVYSGVIVASLHGPGPDGDAEIHRVYRPTAGIVLAAGGSSRLGRSKQMLGWHGEPLARRAARAAVEGGLDPVIVVTGAFAEEVESALGDMRVVIARCEEWQNGQSESLRTGLRRAMELRPDLDGAAFLLCDQPFVGADVVRAVAELRARTLSAACAPRVGGRRCNPVLFGRELFAQLMELSGDSGGRQVLQGVSVSFVDWPDARLGEDIDTAADYERMRGEDS